MFDPQPSTQTLLDELCRRLDQEASQVTGPHAWVLEEAAFDLHEAERIHLDAVDDPSLKGQLT